MYCSSCGAAVSQGRSFCNHCGAKLNRGESVDEASVKPDLLVTAMVASFVFGLAVITALMGVMKVIVGLPVATVLAFSIMPFLLLLIMEGVFIRLLLRRKQPAEISSPTLSQEQAANELEAAQARVLPEARQSVTEHTTRAFDPIYTERK